MDYLFLMDIVQGVAELAYDFSDQPAVRMAVIDEVFKSPAVNPFHHDAVAERRVVYHSVILADACMAEGESYVEILFQQFFVERIAPVLLFQCLVYEESSVLAATVQFVEPLL